MRLILLQNDSFIKLANDIAEIALNHDSIKNILNSKIQGINISDKLIEQTGVIGEKIEIGSFQKIKGEYVGSYIHAGNKLASLVSLSKKPLILLKFQKIYQCRLLQ